LNSFNKGNKNYNIHEFNSSSSSSFSSSSNNSNTCSSFSSNNNNTTTSNSFTDRTDNSYSYNCNNKCSSISYDNSNFVNKNKEIESNNSQIIAAEEIKEVKKPNVIEKSNSYTKENILKNNQIHYLNKKDDGSGNKINKLNFFQNMKENIEEANEKVNKPLPIKTLTAKQKETEKVIIEKSAPENFNDKETVQDVRKEEDKDYHNHPSSRPINSEKDSLTSSKLPPKSPAHLRSNISPNSPSASSSSSSSSSSPSRYQPSSSTSFSFSLFDLMWYNKQKDPQITFLEPSLDILRELIEDIFEEKEVFTLRMVIIIFFFCC
jgi:hypothetical protein